MLLRLVSFSLHEPVQAREVDAHSDLVGAFLGGDHDGCTPFCGYGDGDDDTSVGLTPLSVCRGMQTDCSRCVDAERLGIVG